MVAARWTVPKVTCPATLKHHMESAFLTAVRLLPFGLVASAIGFVFRTSSAPLAAVTLHLVLVVAFGLWAVAKMAHFTDDPWLRETNLSPRWRAFWSAGMVVSFATGLVALTTLASSAALRYDASLQFLQLLSALDIAWAGGALFLGIRWMKGTRVAWAAAIGLGVFCTWSIWNYLRIVGFGPDGAWIVDGSALMRYVLPYDMAAAFIAVLALWSGSRFSVTDHLIEQRSPQS